MARVVESVISSYGEAVHYKKVVTKELEGAMRFQELSKSLGRPAPVPSIFINEELVFDSTPSEDQLKDCLDEKLGL